MPSADLRSHRLARLWRSWLRSESPRRPVLRWNKFQKGTLLLLCVVVALVSSWPWLVEPDLRPGLAAPFDAVAPKDARVVDSEALEQRRSSLGSSTFVQVLDPQENEQIRIVCCGPEPMMEAVAGIADQRQIPCFVSLETPMACGIGICFSCVTRVRDASGDWDYKRTCVAGPVFEASQIKW